MDERWVRVQLASRGRFYASQGVVVQGSSGPSITVTIDVDRILKAAEEAECEGGSVTGPITARVDVKRDD